MTHFEAEDEALARIYKEDGGGVLSVLIGQLRDFDLAEDALHDAVAEAVVNWRRNGPPRNGAAWLLTVARRRAIDRIRRLATARNEAIQNALMAQLTPAPYEAEEEQPIPDERLRLIFTCCHPALGRDAQVALTLRTLGGLSTPEIARAYLVSEATMSQRLVRAKGKIRAAAIPYEVPVGADVAERLVSVLDVLYTDLQRGLFGNRGVESESSGLMPGSHSSEPRSLRAYAPPGVRGLVGAHVVTRRPARTAGDGGYVPIAEQNRSRWNRELIEQGTKLLLYCLGQRRPGPFQIQAALSAVHAEAPSIGETDWEQISGLYAALYEMTPTAVVTLNRAVALANAKSPEVGLELLETVTDLLHDYQPLHAARADLLRRCGRYADESNAYARAIALSTNVSERRFLELRLAAAAKIA